MKVYVLEERDENPEQDYWVRGVYSSLKGAQGRTGALSFDWHFSPTGSRQPPAQHREWFARVRSGLALQPQAGFWRITEIEMDDED